MRGTGYGAENINIPGGMAFSFIQANKSNVNHGSLWNAGTAYKEMFCQFLAKPTGPGYVISSGYGGLHTLLLGFDGDAVNGYYLTGNWYNADTLVNTNFLTADRVRHGEWMHGALLYDGTRITLFINGVPSAIYAYTSNRKVANAYEGTALVGGSDHSGLTGRIAAFGVVEGAYPSLSAPNVSFKPGIDNFAAMRTQCTNGVFVKALVADYRNGSLENLDSGLNHGFLCEGLLSGDTGGYVLPNTVNQTKQNLPKLVYDPFQYTGSATPASSAGFRTFDSFGRADVHYGKNQTLGLGSTELGGYAWQNSANYGILNGNAYPNGQAPGATWFNDGIGNCDIVFTRPATYYPAGVFAYTKYLFNVQDANNFNEFVVDEYGQGVIRHVTGGIEGGNVGAVMAFGGTYGSVTLRLSGNTVEVFEDATSKGTRTLVSNLGQTGKGILLNSPLLRVGSIGVI